MNEGLIDALCGGISGILTNLFTHPLDTVKCRMQTDPKMYKSLFSTSMHIFQHEKFFGFYKGIFANTLVNVPISSMQFMVYGSCIRYLKEKKYIKNKLLNYFVSGSIAGLATIPFIVPLEIIKCNQQVNFQGKTKKENRFIMKTKHIYRKGGLMCFYKGYWSTINRDVLSTGLYFFIYYYFKDYYKSKKMNFDSKQKAMAGGLSGLVTWFVTYPFDTIKTIIQTGPFKERSAKQWPLIKDLVKKNGVGDLYRGAFPALLLSTSFSALNFTFFEISKNILFPKSSF